MSDKELSSKIKELNIPKERVVKFACDCALINIEMIKQYSSDGDYQAIVNFLKHPVSGVVRSTAEAANAAYYAYRAAYYAYRAAYYAAAYYAACAAAFTAEAAYYADHAANAAYYAAAAGNSDKVDTLLDELFAEFE